MGDIALAFDRPIPAIETTGAPAAQAAATVALEAVFAHNGFAQMFTPPPPDFRRLAPKSSRFRLERTGGSPCVSAPTQATLLGEHVQGIQSASNALADGLHPPGFSPTNSHPFRRPIGLRRCVPRLPAPTLADASNPHRRNLRGRHARRPVGHPQNSTEEQG